MEQIVQYKITKKESVIYIICKEGFIDLLKIVKIDNQMMSNFDSKGKTPLIASILNGEQEIYQHLLENKIDINFSDSNGISPLLNVLSRIEKKGNNNVLNAGF